MGMSGERAHDDVVSEVMELQATLRGEAPPHDPDPVTVIEDDLQVRIAGIDGRIDRLERRLDEVDDELSRRTPRPGEPLTWRRLPEFNLCPPVMQLTLDDEIALLQTTIQTRLEREA
jgi:hypothetical protein